MNDIKRSAAYARQVANIANSYDPWKVARNFDIHVHQDFYENVRGFFVPIGTYFYIALNSSLDEVWKRVVLAHELGHVFMHKDSSHYFITEKTLFYPGKFEREANMFATALLVGNEKPECGETIEGFCQRVGIPAEMMAFVNFL